MKVDNNLVDELDAVDLSNMDGLYIGWPSSQKVNDMAGTNEPIRGCISDLIIDGK